MHLVRRAPHQPGWGGEIPLSWEISALLVARSSEENSSEDISHAAQTVSALIPMRYTPRGGFVRGMSLTHGGAIYRMLTPVKLSRLWSVKCIRIHIG